MLQPWMMLRSIIILHLHHTASADQRSLSLAARPIAVTLTSTINFNTKTIRVETTLDMTSHEARFRELATLWSSVTMENQLKNRENRDYHPAIIDNTNPECRELKSMVFEDMKSVSDILEANHIDEGIFLRRKRSTNSQIKRVKKGAFIAKTALGLFSAYMIKKAASPRDSSGKIPLGGVLLSYLFGLAKSDEVKLNHRKLVAISARLNRIHQNQGKLIQSTNITQILINEMASVIERNDAKIIQLFNITDNNKKITERSLLCLQLYTESAHLIQIVKKTINDFILADTLIPKGNKNLFTEADLKDVVRSEIDYRVATGERI